MPNFIKREWSLETGSSYSADGDINLYAWDNWWKRTVYEGDYLMKHSELSSLLLALQRMYLSGYLDGYGFLFEMEASEQERWVRKARRECRKMFEANPTENVPVGIKESLDRVRIARKARSKAAKEASALRKQAQAT